VSLSALTLCIASQRVFVVVVVYFVIDSVRKFLDTLSYTHTHTHTHTHTNLQHETYEIWCAIDMKSCLSVLSRG
jgi:uncharacterized membrane protein